LETSAPARESFLRPIGRDLPQRRDHGIVEALGADAAISGAMSAPRYWFCVITSMSAEDAVPAAASVAAARKGRCQRFIRVPPRSTRVLVLEALRKRPATVALRGVVAQRHAEYRAPGSGSVQSVNLRF